MGTARGLLGSSLGDVARPGSVGMSGNVPSSVSNIPGPIPPINGTVNAHGMVIGVFQGPDDAAIWPELVCPVPSSTFEPVIVRPPSRHVSVQGSMTVNQWSLWRTDLTVVQFSLWLTNLIKLDAKFCYVQQDV